MMSANSTVRGYTGKNSEGFYPFASSVPELAGKYKQNLYTHILKFLDKWYNNLVNVGIDDISATN